MLSLNCAVAFWKPRYAPPVENSWVRHCLIRQLWLWPSKTWCLGLF